MTTKSYTCTLLSDVILNQSMATSGNIATLDYIPGSVFMGIIAREIYNDPQSNAYDILHSYKVKFGDATISNAGHHAYHFPASIYCPKLEKEGSKYLHHLLTEDNYPKDGGNKIQLKQVRSGYITPDTGIELSVQKRFAIKSARDRATRKAKDSQMFGYESIRAGQVFIFSIVYEDDNHIDKVEEALLGDKRIGKSRTAEYSLARIEKLDTSIIHKFKNDSDYTLVYAHSNLCFFNENGQPTLQPTEEQLGVEGKIDWTKSQIRTFEYTSWNGKRNTPNAQRFCIARGSVFYISSKNEGKESYVGEYHTEGLGHILINPAFLFEADGDTAKWNIDTKKLESSDTNSNNSINSPLGGFLLKKKNDKQDNLELSKRIQVAIKENQEKFPSVTSSQWGIIRNYATNAADMDVLIEKLFDSEKGAISHGVAFDKYWNKHGNLKRLKDLVEGKSVVFVGKFAAEMAKEAKKKLKWQKIN